MWRKIRFFILWNGDAKLIALADLFESQIL